MKKFNFWLSYLIYNYNNNKKLNKMEELGLIEKLFSNVVILISVIGIIKNSISLYFLTKYKYPENIESDFDATNYNNELEKLYYRIVMYLILSCTFFMYMKNYPDLFSRGYNFLGIFDYLIEHF